MLKTITLQIDSIDAHVLLFVLNEKLKLNKETLEKMLQTRSTEECIAFSALVGQYERLILKITNAKESIKVDDLREKCNKLFDSAVTFGEKFITGILDPCPKCEKLWQSAKEEYDAGGSPPSPPIKCPHR